MIVTKNKTSFPIAGYEPKDFSDRLEQLKTDQKVTITELIEDKAKRTKFIIYMVPLIGIPLIYTISWIIYILFLSIMTVFVMWKPGNGNFSDLFGWHWITFLVFSCLLVIALCLLTCSAGVLLIAFLQEKEEKIESFKFKNNGVNTYTIIFWALIIIVGLIYLADLLITHGIWGFIFIFQKNNKDGFSKDIWVWLGAWNLASAVIVVIIIFIFIFIFAIFALILRNSSKKTKRVLEKLEEAKAKGKTNSKEYYELLANIDTQKAIVNLTTNSLGINPFSDEYKDIITNNLLTGDNTHFSDSKNYYSQVPEN